MRRAAKRAAVAVAHSILTVVYHVLKDGALYQDLGADYFDCKQPEQLRDYHMRRLVELGYEVKLEPVEAA